MNFEIFTEEDRQKEKDYLASYDLDVKFFQQMGFRIKQIVPERNCFRIETDKGFYCLKKMSQSQEDMLLMQRMAEHLKNNGFSNVFDIVLQQGGEMTTTYEGNKYYLTKWMDGRESDYVNLMDIKAATEALAQFHRSAEGFKAAANTDHRRLFGRWRYGFTQKLKEIQGAADQLTSQGKKDEGSSIMEKYLEVCLKNGKHALALLEEASYYKLIARDSDKQGFIHHDYALYNILHTFDNQTYIGGLETCAFDIRMHDLGYFLFRLLRRKGWDFDFALSIIEYYDAFYPLEKGDYGALAAYLSFPFDYKQINLQHDAEGGEIEDLEELDRINVESEYSILRRNFLREFESYSKLF